MEVVVDAGGAGRQFPDRTGQRPDLFTYQAPPANAVPKLRQLRLPDVVAVLVIGHVASLCQCRLRRRVSRDISEHLPMQAVAALGRRRIELYERSTPMTATTRPQTPGSLSRR
jgi:hypothetical protein